MSTRRFLLIVFALALVVRVWDLADLGLNTDELYIAKHALALAPMEFVEDVHPPAYTLATRAVAAVAPGGPEMKTRLWSVLCGSAFVVLLAYLGFLVGGDKGALLAAALAVFDPTLVALSRLGRSYMMAALVLGGTLPLVWHTVRSPRRGRVIALGLLNGLALYTFYYALYILAAQLVVAFVAGKRDPAARKALISANAIAGVLFLPWVPTLLRQFLRVTEGGGWTVWPLTPYQIVRRFVQLAVTVSPFNALGELAYQYGPRVGALVLCALAILIGARAVSVVRKRQADRGGLAIADAGGRIGLGLPVVYLAVPFAIAYLTHALFGVLIGFPYFAFAATAVWVIVLIALDPAYLPRMSRSVVVAATVASQLALYPHAVAEHREDIREAVADFDAHAAPGAKALTVASFVRDGFLVYSGRSEAAVGLPADLPGRETVGRERAGRLAESDRAAFVDAVADAPEVWLVLSHEMRGEIDRGEGLSRQWLSELGYREMEIQRAAGVRWGRWMKTNKPSETEAVE